MISLRASGAAVLPPTSETEVVGALSTDVVVAEMIVENFRVGERLGAVEPKAGQGGLVRGR